jgi:TatD DNase family protein
MGTHPIHNTRIDPVPLVRLAKRSRVGVALALVDRVSIVDVGRRSTRTDCVSTIATGRSSESTRRSRWPLRGSGSSSISYSRYRLAVVVLVPASARAVNSSRGPGSANPHRSVVSVIHRSYAARGAETDAYHAPVRLIDSHCHVNADRFANDAELVVGAARLAGVERILVPGWNVASSERALELVDRLPWLDAAVGVHPHDAAKVDDAGWERIRAWAADDHVVAIGETGLDYDRVFSPIPDQLTNLRRNLALAAETGKPAILHCRSAAGRRDAQDTLLTEVSAMGSEPPPVVIHSFSGPVDYAHAMLDLGAAISFSGLVFRVGEEASADVAAITPVDRLLVETDSPFLAAPGAPRGRNEPEYVRITADWVAEQRQTTPDALGDALVAAYDQTFPTGAARRLTAPSPVR